MLNIGTTLQLVRKQKQLSALIVANAANVTIDLWHQIERGDRDISVNTLYRVCEVLHIPAPVLLFLHSRKDLIDLLDKNNVDQLNRLLIDSYCEFSKGLSLQKELF